MKFCAMSENTTTSTATAATRICCWPETRTRKGNHEGAKARRIA
jgi:hypothetical protein